MTLLKNQVVSLLSVVPGSECQKRGIGQQILGLAQLADKPLKFATNFTNGHEFRFSPSVKFAQFVAIKINCVTSKIEQIQRISVDKSASSAKSADSLRPLRPNLRGGEQLPLCYVS
jgi:hypothetical protein